MRVVIRSAAVVAAVLFPIIGAAQQPGQPEQARQQRSAQRPQLTEQQHEQLRTFDEQHRTATEAAQRELGDLRRQLDEELTVAQPNSGKINQLRTSIVQKETALAQLRVDRQMKLSSILTPEQRTTLRGRGLGQMFGRGAGGGRGQVRGEIRERVIRPRGGAGQLRGGRGAGMGRGAGGGRGGGGGGAMRMDDARLRAEIRRLEAQLEALRRRIR